MRSLRFRMVLVLVVLAAWLVPRSGAAQQPSAPFEAELEAYEAAVLAELEVLEPDVSDLWRQATDAYETEDGDFEAAYDALSAVLSDHPQWDHALRRRCAVKYQQRQYSLALGDCQAAYDLKQRPENTLALALVLSERSALRDPARALTLARGALQKTDRLYDMIRACEVALNLEDAELLGECSKRLRESAEDTWEAHLFTSFHHALLGETRAATRALEQARANGLDEDNYQQLRAAFEEHEPLWSKYGRRGGIGLLLWIGLAAGLIGAGHGLSRLTLAEAQSALSNPRVSANARDSRLRRAYAAILWLCCAYYYVSIPLILLLVVGLGGGIVVLLLYIGRIPIKLLVIVGVVVIGTVFAVLKSFFTRAKDEPPGELLNLDETPKLRALLEEVAAKVGTRPVDHVYLTPGADIAVFERGGMLAKLRGKGERCLLLGVAVLDGLDTRALRAILAHEYGHFSNEDTAGGNFALGVRRSIVHSAIGLAEVGVADWYNPAWLFLNGFHKLFLRISQGASRLQEVLADRWSARTYGAAAFERGLRHAIAADLRFDMHANATIHEVLEARTGLQNLYSHRPSELPEHAGRIDELVAQAVEAEPSPYDSHPRPADRFRWVRALSGDTDGETDVGEPAWELFEDRAQIEEWMTHVVRARVAEQTGVVIPADPNERARRRPML